MLSFLTKADELDWRLDPDYLAAVAVVETAKAEADRTEAARVAAWREDNVQGVNPPPDSRFWLVKGAANKAAQAFSDAVAIRERAEASAKAACRSGMIDQYREQWAQVEDAIDPLIDALTTLDAARSRAVDLGIQGLPWVVDGAMRPAVMAQWKESSRKVIEQFT